MQTYQDAVLKIVMWWSEKSFRTAMNQNNGDDSDQGGLGFLLMNMVSLKAKERISDEHVKKFEEKLTELLMAAEHKSYMDKALHVDYHPCEKLSISCEYAGIDPSCLPCKTSTTIEKDNKAMCSYQYRGPWVEI